MIDTLLLGAITTGITYMCVKMAVVNDVSHEIRDLLLSFLGKGGNGNNNAPTTK